MGLHAGSSKRAVREVGLEGMLSPNDTSGMTSMGAGSGAMSATGTDCMFPSVKDPTFITLPEMVHPS